MALMALIEMSIGVGPRGGPTFFCLYVETYAHVAAGVDEPVVGG